MTVSQQVQRTQDTAYRQTVYGIAVVLGAVIVVYRRELLPARFSYDGGLIRSFARLSGDIPADSSYGSVAAIYRALGLENAPVVASLLGYAAFLAVLYVQQRRAPDHPRTIVYVGLVTASILLGAVFLGYYSKDVFVLPVVLLVLMLPSRADRWLGADIVLVAAMLLYAGTFRSYWNLIAAAFALLYVLLRRGSSWWVIALAVVVTVATVALLAPTVLDGPISDIRADLNSGRQDSVDATSLITPPIAGGGFVNEVGSVLSVMVILVAPVPLAALGGVYYLITSAAILTLWAATFAGFRRLGRQAAGDRNAVLLRCAALLVSFWLTQALFEPDYGSALRHITPLLPLMLQVIGGAALATGQDRRS